MNVLEELKKAGYKATINGNSLFVRLDDSTDLSEVRKIAEADGWLYDKTMRVYGQSMALFDRHRDIVLASVIGEVLFGVGSEKEIVGVVDDDVEEFDYVRSVRAVPIETFVEQLLNGKAWAYMVATSDMPLDDETEKVQQALEEALGQPTRKTVLDFVAMARLKKAEGKEAYARAIIRTAADMVEYGIGYYEPYDGTMSFEEIEDEVREYIDDVPEEYDVSAEEIIQILRGE